MQVKAIAIFMLAFVLLLAGCKQGGKAAYDRGMDCLEKEIISRLSLNLPLCYVNRRKKLGRCATGRARMTVWIILMLYKILMPQ